MNNGRLKVNFILQIVYQSVILLIPLIISPYLTRVLGDYSLGVYTYINSIGYYFVIIANLGILKYGQRLIARQVSNEERRKAFWGLYWIHLMFSVVALLLYFCFVFLFITDNKLVYFATSLYVLSSLFDVTWYYYGTENFIPIVIVSIITKLVELLLVFLFVKTSNDLLIYSLIASGMLLINSLIPFLIVPVFEKPCSIKTRDCTVHIKPLFIFSLSVIAISLYTVFDKTLLGTFSTTENVAYYEYANKIINVPKCIIAVIGTVMFPRASKLVSLGESKSLNKLISISLCFVAFVGFASLFGIVSIGKLLSIIYYGESFKETGFVMVSMAGLPLIVGLGDVIRSQIMIPNSKDKQYIVCIIINAIINLLLSFALINPLGVYGVVIGTYASELFGTIFQIYICRKLFDTSMILKKSAPFLVIGIIMHVVLMVMKPIFNDDLFSLIIQIIIGGAIYCVLSITYCLFFEKDMVNWILNKHR